MSLSPPMVAPAGGVHPGTTWVIRPFEPSDAPAACELFALARWGPFRDGHGFDATDLLRGVAEQGIVHFFVAMTDDGSAVGAIALTCSSVQRPSRRHGVFGDHFVVHPALRGSSLARELMLHAEAACYLGGYRRADAHVDHDNLVAQRLYRRTGFRRISAEPCDHGCLLLESHLPLVIRYLLDNGMAADGLVDQLLTPRGLIELLPPTRRRSNAVDVIAWHGSEVVPYELRLDAGPITLLVDRVIDAVTAVSSSQVEMACWPEGGRAVASGALVRVRYRVRNLTSESASVGISEAIAGHAVHAEVSPGGECRGVIAFRPRRAGRHSVSLVVEVDGEAERPPLRLPLDTWFEVHRPVAQRRRRPSGFAVDGRGLGRECGSAPHHGRRGIWGHPPVAGWRARCGGAVARRGSTVPGRLRGRVDADARRAPEPRSRRPRLGECCQRVARSASFASGRPRVSRPRQVVPPAPPARAERRIALRANVPRGHPRIRHL